MNIVHIRLLSQQLASPQFDTPADVVSHFGAMQAQEYRLMRWAVEMRTRRPSGEDFEKAFNSGEIIRLHLLRGTWQLICREDYPWMLPLFAPKAERTIRGWMSANGISIPEKELLDMREILAQTASDLGSATKEDFADALAQKGIVMDDHRLSYHIRLSELSGLLCSGDLLPMKATYALAKEKIGNTESSLTREESLALLARKYFQGHSPATFEDFVWWSGLGVNDCRKGIAMLGDELKCHKGFFVLDSCRQKGYKKSQALLLPPYDEYLIGYKSRSIVLPEEFQSRAHNNSGNFYPIVVREGIICGNWSPFKKELEVSFFNSLDICETESACWKKFKKVFK